MDFMLSGSPAHAAQTAPKRSRRSFYIWMLVGALLGAGAVFNALVPEAEREPEREKSSASGRDPCGDLGGFHVCVDKAEFRASVSNALERTTAGSGATFVLVNLSITSTKKSTATVSPSDFTLRNAAGESWQPDVDGEYSLLGSRYRQLGLSEQVHPGTKTSGWLTFYVPLDATDSLYLRFKPGLVKKLDLALPLARPASCRAEGKIGSCIETARCKGRRIPGLCEGARNVQCCIE